MFRRLWNDLERFRPFAGMMRAFARVCMVFAWIGSWQLVAYRCRAGRSLRRVLPGMRAVQKSRAGSAWCRERGCDESGGGKG